jgi:hypothetical protein
MPRELRHPAPPGKSAFGVAVQHQHGFGVGPRIGEIVDLVVHVEIG